MGDINRKAVDNFYKGFLDLVSEGKSRLIEDVKTSLEKFSHGNLMDNLPRLILFAQSIVDSRPLLVMTEDVSASASPKQYLDLCGEEGDVKIKVRKSQLTF